MLRTNMLTSVMTRSRAATTKFSYDCGRILLVCMHGALVGMAAGSRICMHIQVRYLLSHDSPGWLPGMLGCAHIFMRGVAFWMAPCSCIPG